MLISFGIFAQVPLTNIDYSVTLNVDNTLNKYYNLGSIIPSGVSVNLSANCNNALWKSSKTYNFQAGGNPSGAWLKVEPTNPGAPLSDWELQVYFYADSTQIRIKNIASHGGTVPVTFTIAISGQSDAKFIANNATGSDATALSSYNSLNPIIITNSLGYKPRRPATYSGTTDANGAYTATFATPFTVAPNIQASLVPQSQTNQYIRISSISTTGFTVNAYQFNTNNVLGIINLINTTSNIVGANIDVLVTEK